MFIRLISKGQFKRGNSQMTAADCHTGGGIEEKKRIFKSMISAIIIDDEQHCIDALAADLSANCANVEVLSKCTSAKEGIFSIKKHRPHLIFLDVENAMDERF